MKNRQPTSMQHNVQELKTILGQKIWVHSHYNGL